MQLLRAERTQRLLRGLDALFDLDLYKGMHAFLCFFLSLCLCVSVAFVGIKQLDLTDVVSLSLCVTEFSAVLAECGCSGSGSLCNIAANDANVESFDLISEVEQELLNGGYAEKQG